MWTSGQKNIHIESSLALLKPLHAVSHESCSSVIHFSRVGKTESEIEIEDASVVTQRLDPTYLTCLSEICPLPRSDCYISCFGQFGQFLLGNNRTSLVQLSLSLSNWKENGTIFYNSSSRMSPPNSQRGIFSFIFFQHQR